MSLLIVSATAAEIEGLKSLLEFKESKSGHLSTYQFGEKDIDILTTGVGMVATTYRLSQTLSKKRYSFVLNAGIGGSFDTSKFPLGEVVNVSKEMIADLGSEDGEEFLNVVDLKLQDPDEFPFRNGYLVNDSVLTHSDCLNKLPKVIGISVNKGHGNEKSVEQVIKKYQPEVESMEGAAIFYVCSMEKVPFAQIRSISNKVERRDRDKWNIGLAVKNLNERLFEIIKELSI